jgi:Arc/MetJ family transcription regulator
MDLDISASLYHNNSVRTTVTLDDDIYQAAAHLSRVSGKRLGKVVSEMARRGIARHNEPATGRKKRFPTFDVPKDAPVIPASRIQDFIDEEGYF